MDTPRKSGLVAAIAAYALLATLATLTLTGKMRIAVWIFLGGMAVKTWLSSLHHS
jgi:predicted membrane channel-forming protein YqfA (hemolysin III family)